ncbi:hypothetical protein FQA39_LY14651 [Lamprigera yunnana]|nr:hypothetical protein FQA39_LY14651 [Lamprigera yunnana]
MSKSITDGSTEYKESSEADTSNNSDTLFTIDFDSGEENIVLSEVEAEDVSELVTECSDDNLPDNINFQWRDCNKFQPDVYNFDNTGAGVRDLFDIEEDEEEYDYLIKNFDVVLVQTIVNETNIL